MLHVPAGCGWAPAPVLSPSPGTRVRATSARILEQRPPGPRERRPRRPRRQQRQRQRRQQQQRRIPAGSGGGPAARPATHPGPGPQEGGVDGCRVPQSGAASGPQAVGRRHVSPRWAGEGRRHGPGHQAAAARRRVTSQRRSPPTACRQLTPKPTTRHCPTEPFTPHPDRGVGTGSGASSRGGGHAGPGDSRKRHHVRRSRRWDTARGDPWNTPQCGFLPEMHRAAL